MNEINSVVFLRSYRESLKNLPVEYRAIMYDMIMDYAFDGIEPDLDISDLSNNFCMALFSSFKKTIDDSIAKYNANINNGKKGGRPSTKSNDSQINDDSNQEQTKEEPEENPSKTQNNPTITQENPSKTQNNPTKPNQNLDKDKDKDKDMDKDMEDINSSILQDTSIDLSTLKHVVLSPTQVYSLKTNIPGIETYIKQFDDFLDANPKLKKKYASDYYQGVLRYYTHNCDKPLTFNGIPI